MLLVPLHPLCAQSDTAPIRINRNNNPGFTFAIYDVKSAGAYVRDNCSAYRENGGPQPLQFRLAPSSAAGGTRLLSFREIILVPPRFDRRRYCM